MLDQPHNAKTIYRLGVSPGIIPFSKLSARRLSPLIQACVAKDINGSTLRRMAQTRAEQVNQESSESLDKYCQLLVQYGNTQVSRRRLTKDRMSSASASGSDVDTVSKLPFIAGSNSTATIGNNNLSGKTQLPARESASSILYSSNTKPPAFGRSNTLGYGDSGSGSASSKKGMLTPKGLARSESIGPGMLLDLDADSDSAGMWGTNYTPIHAAAGATARATGAIGAGRDSGSAKKMAKPSGLLSTPLIENE